MIITISEMLNTQNCKKNEVIALPQDQHHCWKQLWDVSQSCETGEQLQLCLQCCIEKQQSSGTLADRFYTDITTVLYQSYNYFSVQTTQPFAIFLSH